jgi:hypothetical protein
MSYVLIRVPYEVLANMISRLSSLVTKIEVFAFSLGHGYGARNVRSYIRHCKVVYNMESSHI